MFEKEAEELQKQIQQEYLDLGKNGAYPPLWERIGELWRKGAEFGYNKANEWHYVKDGLPDEGTYLVVWQNDKGYKEIFIMNYEEDDEEELHWVDGEYDIQDEYVIAWKEIVLPKED